MPTGIPIPPGPKPEFVPPGVYSVRLLRFHCNQVLVEITSKGPLKSQRFLVKVPMLHLKVNENQTAELKYGPKPYAIRKPDVAELTVNDVHQSERERLK